MPALFTSSPIRGWRAMTLAAIAPTASRSPTSHVSCSAPSASATATSRAAPRATRTHCQPRFVSSRASAAPMPLEPPVTTATGRSADANAPEGLGLASGGVRDDGRQLVRALLRAARSPDRAEDPLVRLLDARHLALPVVEADRGYRRRRRGGDDELCPARQARAFRRRDPRHDRAGDDREASAEEAGVRHRLVPRGRDVLRLLEVAGHDPHELRAGKERLRVLRDREHRDARLVVVAH